MYHIKQTHNLEVPGSSPGWSTKKAVTKFVTAFFVPLRKMKHHLTILHAGITRFKHFMYKQQEEGKLKK